MLRNKRPLVRSSRSLGNISVSFKAIKPCKKLYNWRGGGGKKNGKKQKCKSASLSHTRGRKKQGRELGDTRFGSVHTFLKANIQCGGEARRKQPATRRKYMKARDEDGEEQTESQPVGRHKRVNGKDRKKADREQNEKGYPQWCQS